MKNKSDTKNQKHSNIPKLVAIILILSTLIISKKICRDYRQKVKVEQFLKREYRNYSYKNHEKWTTRLGHPYELKSELAKEIKKWYTNCKLPIRTYNITHAGFGSDLHVFSQAVCQIYEDFGARTVPFTNTKWLWAYSEACGYNSDIHCYFKLPTCAKDRNKKNKIPIQSDPISLKRCSYDKSNPTNYRKAFTEFLFSYGLTDVVKHEVGYQIGKVFGGEIPVNLITVHIRWGNKKNEMKLVPIEDYINAVKKIISENNFKEVNIYLASEDPLAVMTFEASVPHSWNVFKDFTLQEEKANRRLHGNDIDGIATDQVIASKTLGRYGLECLASLVLAMEANHFVLTTGSNFSRLMNELRSNVLDPRCNNCTTFIDLRNGEYK